ncbi:PAS domain-containing sensor histidine kinase [Rubrobacter xylanophilus]|uniref:Sensor-like histidine kinase SenX3 n=1 Tax=Rubrobacter xylanophilus TaxID=49319 RepID=A0A510HG33_9ACTN|nr:ATP-binding protein [Rubrobacter xylanophilus]BBL78205.1 PAS domain-containing sensor histidine kinase [Rubrobacter xylanophilus]
MEAENTLLIQRSRTANAGATEFIEGLRRPEDQTLPPPESYAGELVQTVSDPTGLAVLYVGPGGEPLAARDGLGNQLDPRKTYERLGLERGLIERVSSSPQGKGVLTPADGTYITVWPLLDAGGVSRGVMVYDVPQDELDQSLSYLRLGILGAIGTSVLLAGMASLLLTRQITRPLSETRDAAIRVASGDYSTPVPVTSRDELGEMARAFNYMAGEIEHYIGEIQDQKRHLEAVLEASLEALVATDHEGRITMANAAAARMLGVRPGDGGRTLREVGVAAEILGVVREAAETGFSVREVELGEKSFWAYAARMDRGGRSQTGVILAVRDITEYRALERAKSAFVSDFSHELRTPLTTIQSAVGLLQRARERLDPLENRALELAEGELGRIRAMVEELMTLSQMDSWQYSLQLAPASLDRILQDAVEAVEPKALRFGIEINLYGAHINLTCDAQKLYQVFLNLLDNAVKYSEEGSRVDVTASESGEYAIVRVKDTGVGIPEKDLPHLFERFYRVEKDRSRSTGGSGLGLAICKQIVEMHGGTISVESRLGEGSTFTVRLPKNPRRPEAPNAG